MNIVQNIMERLRPLVGLKGWDYCVLWKLSEDQRFLEWTDCCCGGAESTQNGGEELLFPVSSVVPCRDVTFQHSRIQPCDLLAQLPSSMPLGSGTHALTLISNQPRWLNFSNNSDSNVSEETIGTRALIPLPGGLIELFVAKQISEDQQVIDFVTAQCNISLEHQAMINSSNIMETTSLVNANTINEIQSNAFAADDQTYQQKDPINPLQPLASPRPTSLESLNLPYDISVDRIQPCSSPLNFLQQFNFTSSENRAKNIDMLLEGTSNTCAFVGDKGLSPFNASAEDGFQQMDEQHVPIMSTGMHTNNEQQRVDKDSIKQQTVRSDSISDCSDPNDDEDNAKYRRRTGKGPQSKNLVAERKRRKKLNDRLYALRALVPKISKLDRAAILGDAVEFVKELQKQVEDLQHELEEHSDEEGGRKKINGAHSNHDMNGQSEILNQSGFHMGPKREHEKPPKGLHVAAPCNGIADSSKQNHDSEITNDKAREMEPQVEVAQLEGKQFFIKVICEHKPGGFVRLMEALSALGLDVANVNVTSFRCLVSNVFIVEKRDSEMVQADHVRDSLLEITRKPSGGWPEIGKASENGNDVNGLDYHHHSHHIHAQQIGSHHHSRLHHAPSY